MGSRTLQDDINQTELKFSDHADLENVAIYIHPIENNIDHDQIGLCCVVKRKELEKMLWWCDCQEKE